MGAKWKKNLKGNGANTKSALSIEDLIESQMDQKVLDWAYGYSMFSVSLWDESLSVKKAKIVLFLVIFEQRKDNKFCRVKELRIEVLMPLMMGVFKWLSKTAASSLLVLELENRHKPGNCARSKNRRFRQGQGVPFILDSIQALKRFFGKLKRQKNAECETTW